MEWWHTLASKRSSDGNGEWVEALERFAGNTSIATSDAQILAEKCRRPDQLRLLADLFRSTSRERETPQERVRLFLSIVDESPLSLGDWIEGLHVFYQWLNASGRDTSFGMALGFIQCCADATGESPGLTDLSAVVEEMLKTYGFDG